MAVTKTRAYLFDGHMLAFGLVWQPIIAGHSEQLAKRLARQSKASHYVAAGRNAASVGMANFAKKGRRRTAYYSAAQLFALHHANGTFAAIYPINKQSVWLVAAHEGAVITRTDRLCRSHEVADSILDDLKKAYPQLRVLATPESNDWFTPLLADGSDRLRSCRLMPVQRFAAYSNRVVLAGFMGFAAIVIWKFLPELTPRPQPITENVAEQHAILWQQAVQNTASRVHLHTVHSSHLVLQHLYRLPVQLAGWVLNRVECQYQHPRWRCTALLKRSDLRATNAGLFEVVPKQWSLRFSSIDQLQATWDFVVPVVSLDQTRIPTGTDIQKNLFSYLQGLQPAFNEITFGEAIALPVPPPLDSEGLPISPPADLLTYRSRSLSVRGPLRSMSILLPHLQAIAWRQLVLSVGEPSSVNLLSSQLTLALNGAIYENHRP